MILRRLTQQTPEPVSQEAAKYLLSIRFAESDIDRMDELSSIAREGTLHEQADSQLDSCIHVSNLLAILQSRASRVLGSISESAGSEGLS